MPRAHLRVTLAHVAAVALLAGCRPDAPSADPVPPPPAEFMIAAGDSAFWVTSHGGTVKVRGAPLELARIDGRFYELYVADDERLYEDATFVGQRVYRRDLITGDSLLVYQDSLVPRVARQYLALHPGEEPLRPTDEPNDSPRWSALATLDLGEVAGPYVSYALHTDVDRSGAPAWHTSRRGVLDLRRGGSATLEAVVGPQRAVVEQARMAAFRAALDSVRRAAGTVPNYRLDPSSFALTTVDGAPAIVYAVPAQGEQGAGHLLSLPPIRIAEPSWWSEAATAFPVGSAGGSRDVWRSAAYEVVVHYDSLSGNARLALRDSTSREWTVARIPSPATRIFWLDRPPLDSVTRRALLRAFEESSLYDEAVRTASRDLSSRADLLRPRLPRA